MLTEVRQIGTKLFDVVEVPVKYKDVYVAHVSFMHGDADFYSNDDWILYNEQDVLNFYAALDDMYRLARQRDWNATDLSEASYPHFMVLTEAEYNEAKEKPFDEQDYDVKYAVTYERYLTDLEIDWPRDKSCDDCGDASFNGFTLSWYDQNGVEYHVKERK